MKRLIFCLVFMLLSVNTIAAQRIELSREKINQIAESVVYIETIDRFGDVLASGSGTIISETGLIYTNRHVIEDGKDFHIFLIEDMQELPVSRYYARLVAVYDEIDFAILQIDRDNRLRPIDPDTLQLPALAASTEGQLVNYGDPIYIFGYPDIGDGYLVLTQGTITTIENGNIAGTRLPVWYRTDAEMSSGNSGGLVVNNDGQFLGIPTWVRKADTTMGQLGGILPLLAIEATIADNDGTQGLEDAPDTSAPTGAATFILENDSSDIICYLYLSPSTSTEWGSNQIDVGLIAPGDVFTLDADAGTYDLLLEDCDHGTLDDQRRLVLDDQLYLTYTDAGIDDAPVYDLEQALFAEVTYVAYDVAFDDEPELGIKIYAYIRATGYKDVPVRVAMFYNWADGTPMSGANAQRVNRTTNGYLTVQEVLVPEYEDTEWDGFWFWMPYSAFPDVVGGKQEAYAEVQMGVDGEDFTEFSNYIYFTLTE